MLFDVNVNVGVCRRFLGNLTQFLHSSQLHLLVYEAMFVDVRRRLRGWHPRRLGPPDYRV
jgi:hypothetical protein